MVSVLVNIFGSENFQLAEDVVQDALISALETWKYKGMPDNPTAWLYRTAKNKAIDIIRRSKHSKNIDFSNPDHQLLTSEYTIQSTMDNFWNEDHIKDDFLGMMYACCHSEISRENQITFILKTLCGFSTKEVAKAFLTSEDTVSKRLFRTKEYFRKNKTRPKIPSKHEIETRTDAVLSTIYLMFNEGYNSTHSDDLIREDIISQAMILCKSLLESPKTQLPEAYALMALMCLHAARSQSRISPEGELIVLKNQDRDLWNSELINMGNMYLNKAAFGNKVSSYHLEAAIAFEHCTAKDYKSTNWNSILNSYDALLSIAFDPIIYLNRCLAILEIEGPKAALSELAILHDNKQMKKYYLYYAILGAIHEQLEDKIKAKDYFKIAISLTHSNSEKHFLKEKITNL